MWGDVVSINDDLGLEHLASSLITIPNPNLDPPHELVCHYVSSRVPYACRGNAHVKDYVSRRRLPVCFQMIHTRLQRDLAVEQSRNCVKTVSRRYQGLKSTIRFGNQTSFAKASRDSAFPIFTMLHSGFHIRKEDDRGIVFRYLRMDENSMARRISTCHDQG
jgi:hypothetical protein